MKRWFHYLDPFCQNCENLSFATASLGCADAETLLPTLNAIYQSKRRGFQPPFESLSNPLFEDEVKYTRNRELEKEVVVGGSGEDSQREQRRREQERLEQERQSADPNQPPKIFGAPGIPTDTLYLPGLFVDGGANVGKSTLAWYALIGNLAQHTNAAEIEEEGIQKCIVCPTHHDFDMAVVSVEPNVRNFRKLLNDHAFGDGRFMEKITEKRKNSANRLEGKGNDSSENSESSGEEESPPAEESPSAEDAEAAEAAEFQRENGGAGSGKEAQKPDNSDNKLLVSSGNPLFAWIGINAALGDKNGSQQMAVNPEFAVDEVGSLLFDEATDIRAVRETVNVVTLTNAIEMALRYFALEKGEKMENDVESGNKKRSSSPSPRKVTSSPSSSSPLSSYESPAFNNPFSPESGFHKMSLGKTWRHMWRQDNRNSTFAEIGWFEGSGKESLRRDSSQRKDSPKSEDSSEVSQAGAKSASKSKATPSILFPKESPIFFLKLDIEGYEARVLVESRELLETKKVKFLVFEYSEGAWLGESLAAVIRLMNSVGYFCFLITQDELFPISYEFWDKVYANPVWSNVFCGIAYDKDLELFIKMYHSHWGNEHKVPSKKEAKGIVERTQEAHAPQGEESLVLMNGGFDSHSNRGVDNGFVRAVFNSPENNGRGRDAGESGNGGRAGSVRDDSGGADKGSELSSDDSSETSAPPDFSLVTIYRNSWKQIDNSFVHGFTDLYLGQSYPVLEAQRLCSATAQCTALTCLPIWEEDVESDAIFMGDVITYSIESGGGDSGSDSGSNSADREDSSSRRLGDPGGDSSKRSRRSTPDHSSIHKNLKINASPVFCTLRTGEKVESPSPLREVVLMRPRGRKKPGNLSVVSRDDFYAGDEDERGELYFYDAGRGSVNGGISNPERKYVGQTSKFGSGNGQSSARSSARQAYPAGSVFPADAEIDAFSELHPYLQWTKRDWLNPRWAY